MSYYLHLPVDTATATGEANEPHEATAPVEATYTSEPSTQNFVDLIVQRAGTRNDAELCHKLGLNPSHISKIRHKRLAVSAETVLLLHEGLDIPLKEIREMAVKTGTRLSAAIGKKALKSRVDPK